jgi:hypothetical protein
MVTSLTNLTGWIARLLLAATALCFNGPRLLVPDGPTQGMAAEQTNTQPEEGGKREFQATVTVGQGKKQVTLRLEIGRAGERGQNEAL